MSKFTAEHLNVGFIIFCNNFKHSKICGLHCKAKL